MSDTNNSPGPGGLDDELLTDAEGARLLKVGPTRFLELQKVPGFPPPVWLGPRGKRHVRSRLIRFALTRTERPVSRPKARKVARQVA